MYTEHVENHQTVFLVHLFWRSPCPVSPPRHSQPRCMAGTALPKPGGADKPVLPQSLCPPPPSSGNTDNEAREPAMGPQLFCSQGAGWNQAPLGWSQEVPVTRVILLAATLSQTPPSWQPLLHSDLLFPISLPFRYHQMGAVGTFLSVIFFLSGDFNVPEACAGRLPLEPPKKGSGRGGWGSGLLPRTELVLLLTSSSVDA